MWSAVYKKLWIVILLPLSAAGIAYLFTNKKASSYRSVAIIEASIPDQPVATHTLKDIPEPEDYYNNMVGAMKTELITSMVSYRLLLHDLEKEIAFRPPAIQYSDARKESTKKILEKKLASFELLSQTNPAEQTINQVIHNMNYNIGQWIRDGEISVERRPGSNEIEVATSSEDPFLSAFTSNTLSSEYIRFETLIKTPPPANDSIGFYRQEVDRLRKNMEAKTGELNEAQTVKPAGSQTNDARFQRVKADRIAEYEMRITEEEWELNALRERLAKIERPETPEPQQTKVDVSGNAKIQAIRNKIDQLSGIYAQGGSKDKKLDSIINVLRKQLTDETIRLQKTSQPAVATNNNSAANRDREMLESRIRRHEENIAAIRNDIRRVKNSTQPASGTTVNTKLIAQLQDEQDKLTSQYNSALAHLKSLEAKSGTEGARGRHLVLKEKALPSAEPESPWAMFIIISAYFGTLAICLIVIAATRPTQPPMDDIFLRVNYQRRLNKKSTPVTESGPA